MKTYATAVILGMAVYGIFGYCLAVSILWASVWGLIGVGMHIELKESWRAIKGEPTEEGLLPWPLPWSLRVALGVFAAAAGVAAWWAYGPAPAAKAYDPVRLQAWEAKVAPRLGQTDAAAGAAMQRAIDRIPEFIQRRKERTRAFAAEVLGLSGKVNFVLSKLPGVGDKADYQRYLEKKFAETVFSPDELKGILESAVQGWLSYNQGLENELLVATRVDIADSVLASGQPVLVASTTEAFRQDYERMAQALTPRLTYDVGVFLGRGALSWYGSETGKTIALRVYSTSVAELGLSGTMLGSGAAASTVSLGTTLLLTIIIERAIDAFLRSQLGYDPEGRIAEEVNRTLDQIGTLIVDGNPDAHWRYQGLCQHESTWWQILWRSATQARQLEQSGELGLRHALQKLHEARAKVREAALKKLILEGGQ